MPVKLPKYKSLFNSYRSKALPRGLCFELSFDFFVSLVTQPCFYCGDLPSALTTKGKVRRIAFMGVDRLDSSKGYIQENVVSCCCKCNWTKLDWTIDEFKSHIKRMVEYQCEL